MTLTEFLDARISEDEREALDAPKMSDIYDVQRAAYTPHMRARTLAEVASKRKVVQYGAGLRLDRTRDAETGAQHRSVHWILQQMARVYADHPDYREDWSD